MRRFFSQAINTPRPTDLCFLSSLRTYISFANKSYFRRSCDNNMEAGPFRFPIARSCLWTLKSFVLVSAFSLPVAMSLGEICSKYPTSSGTYSWSFQLASFKHRVLLSWINGWLVTVGYWVLTLSVTFVRTISSSHPIDRAIFFCSRLQGTSQFILSGVNIFLPNWEATAWQNCQLKI